MTVLQLGSTGPDVGRWQEILGVPVDYRFSGETECATIDWQTAHGLEPDGVVGPKTWAVAESHGDTTMGFIPNQITPVSDNDVVQALSNAYKHVTGSAPNRSKLGLMVGQVALETGGTGKGTLRSVHNYNLGNIRGEYNGAWTSFKAGEIQGGKEVILDVGAKNKFRAYPSLLDGAIDYVKMLQSRPHWWNGLQTGSVDGFIKGLTTYPAYFTANANVYANVMRERMANYAPLIAQYGAAGIGAAVAAAAAAAAGYLGYQKYKRR